MRSLWLVVILYACGVSVSAQTTKEYPYESGNAFVRLCSGVEQAQRTDADPQLGVGCILYIVGIVDGVETGNLTTMIQMRPTTVPKSFCRPDSVENGQLVKIVLKYVRENPEEAHQPTRFVALWAFQKAFPCPSK
jgi:hypothetical protein